MCLQCCADSELIYEDILPGFHLVRARKSFEMWNAGEYALVRMNDPDIVFSNLEEFVEDPGDNFTDEEFEKFDYALEKIDDSLFCEPKVGYQLILAAITVGYDPERVRFSYWLCDYVARKLNEKTKEA
jgi:hypothetical protein